MADYYRDIAENQLPKAHFPAQAEMAYERWASQSDLLDAATRQQAEQVAADGAARRLLDAVFGNSPFLSECALRDIPFTCRLLCDGPDAAVDFALRAFAAGGAGYPGIETIGTEARIGKRRIALATAIADIAGTWPLERVTQTLSNYASAAVDTAAGQLLLDQHKRGKLTLPDPANPCRGSGYLILGMGKLGARELNYSSDIDIIVLYDQDVVETPDPYALQQIFVRLTRNLVKAIDERTADGYVFRTDLRLRPDPGSTPIALSVLAAETYYESVGQNWERAAMIKARPIAGDIDAGARFLSHLAPYIWRKNLDFATIQDVHSIKRQINAHKGGARIHLKGHNVKLGRGGIREIEFYAQTQQLIWGGRESQLRGITTMGALDSLVAADRIAAAARDDLARAYRYLRRVEHRLQMIQDEQTHVLPGTENGIAAVATFMGYATPDVFRDALMAELRRVEGHYADLFEESADLSAHGEVQGNLVFTGADVDPDTLQTIEKLGFSNAKTIDKVVRSWHHARYRSTRSVRSRQILTELMPALLAALSHTAEPDAAFLKFDEFLSRLPSGVQLFSMFHAKPQLLEMVAEIMGTAPRLAHHLAGHPALLESVLSTEIDRVLASRETLEAELDQTLAQARDFQDILDLSRRWTNDRRFLIGVQTLKGSMDLQTAAGAYSDVAEAAINRLFPHVHAEFSHRHGVVPGSEMGILALGKLGSREMTPTSDLDLIIVYDRGAAEDSDGDRPLPIQQYYARLSQRLINAITAPTGEGILYEVDMRLRPSGNAGPIACGLDSFLRYQLVEAWTWEHMALTRARPIFGSPALRATVKGMVRQVLTKPREPNQLVRAVADMRQRMDKEHHSDFIWEIKHRRGGMVDIEFICQYLQLRHGADHPEILDIGTRDALSKLRAAGLIDAKIAGNLLGALDLWQTVQGLLRLTIEGYFGVGREEELSPDLRTLLVHASGVSSFAALLDCMENAATSVVACYDTLVVQPAKQ